MKERLRHGGPQEKEIAIPAEHAPVEIELLPGYKQLPPCVEDGATFEENATKKARHYAPHATGLLFADDSGLEVDALGGIMGKVADLTAIQYRMLNASKGPAVWSPRAQADKIAYQSVMKKMLEETPNLFIKQGTTEDLVVENHKVVGVETQEGIAYRRHPYQIAAIRRPNRAEQR